MKRTEYQDILKERLLIFDGAMGTHLQRYNLTVDDDQGKEGCTEVLNFSHPEWLKEIHASFFKVGSDIVETNSFILI